MSEEHGQQNKQQTILIALVAVVVVLVAALGFMIYQTNNSLPEPTAQAPTQTAPTGQDPAGDGATAPTQEIDPSKAIKVKSGTTPEEWVNEYYAACDKGDFKTAVAHLPADKQASTTPESLKEQLGGYGITGYSVLSAKSQGDTTLVDAEQTTKSFGTFVNTWTFQKDGKDWVVISKAVSGMK